MRIGLPALLMLLLTPVVLFSQESPTVDQMKQMLDASQRRGQLEIDGGVPFHLLASYEEFDSDGRPAGKGSIDELWEGPKRYRQTLTLPAIERVKLDGNGQYRQVLTAPVRKLIEVDSGTQLWRTGEWVLFDPVVLGLQSALKPFQLRSPTTNRLSYRDPLKKNIALECIGTEPDLPGVADDTRLAQTTYCMEKGSHLLRLISRPNFVEISFNDLQPFGKKFIARSIQVGINGRIHLKLHIEVLEAAENFNTLNGASPEGAQMIPFHRADLASSWLTGELMRGQLLNKVSPHYPQSGLHGNIVVKVHVDAAGAVDSEEVLRSENQILKAPVLEAVKQWRFRVSYQGDKVVPVDYIFIFYDGGDDAGEESP